MNFPVKTFLVCLTAWSVTTEFLIFDYLKFSARAELLGQVSRAMHAATTLDHL